MSEKDQFYSALKFHFFPKLLTPWDVKRVLDASSLSIREVLNGTAGESKNFGKGTQRLVNSAILRLQPIYNIKGDKKVLVKERVENWLTSYREGVNSLIEIGKEDMARKLTLNFASSIGFMITKYVSSQKLPEEFEELFGKMKFSEGWALPLETFLKDNTWKRTLESINFRQEFYLLISANFHNVYTLQGNKKERGLPGELQDLSSYRKKLKQYFKATIEKPPTYYTVKALEISSVVGLEGVKTWEQGEATTLLSKIGDSLIKTETEDTFPSILRNIYHVAKYIIEDDQEKIFNKFQDIGVCIVRERLKFVGMTEKLGFTISPSVLSAISSPPTPFLDLFEELDPDQIPLLPSETSRKISNWSNQVKFFLLPLLARYPSSASAIRNVIRDPLGSIALLSLVGPLFPYVVDCIMISTKRDYGKAKVNKWIQGLTLLFREKVDLLLKLGETVEDPTFSNVLDFFASREVFWSEFRLISKEVKEKIKSLKAGSDLLKVFSELQSLTDVTAKSPLKRKRAIPEEIKDLYI